MSANPDEQHQRQIQARIDACQNELGNLEAEQQRLADRYATLKARIDALREELQPSHCQAEPFDQWSADVALAEKRGGRDRDPLLPPPEVCDWLLAQDWSDVIPETFITYPMGGAEVVNSRWFDYCSAGIEIGADEGGHISLPVEALEALRADRDARQEAIERKRAAIKSDELERKRQRDEDRPCELGVLPMIISETGADDEPEIERIICSAISGGADYANDMPRELSLQRITQAGTFSARYLQGPLEVAISSLGNP